MLITRTTLAQAILGKTICFPICKELETTHSFMQVVEPPYRPCMHPIKSCLQCHWPRICIFLRVLASKTTPWNMSRRTFPYPIFYAEPPIQQKLSLVSLCPDLRFFRNHRRRLNRLMLERAMEGVVQTSSLSKTTSIIIIQDLVSYTLDVSNAGKIQVGHSSGCSHMQRRTFCQSPLSTDCIITPIVKGSSEHLSRPLFVLGYEVERQWCGRGSWKLTIALRCFRPLPCSPHIAT